MNLVSQSPPCHSVTVTSVCQPCSSPSFSPRASSSIILIHIPPPPVTTQLSPLAGYLSVRLVSPTLLVSHTIICPTATALLTPTSRALRPRRHIVYWTRIVLGPFDCSNSLESVLNDLDRRWTSGNVGGLPLYTQSPRAVAPFAYNALLPDHAYNVTPTLLIGY